jgi:hypothetical protein
MPQKEMVFKGSGKMNSLSHPDFFLGKTYPNKINLQEQKINVLDTPCANDSTGCYVIKG